MIKNCFSFCFFWDSMYSGRAAQSSFPPDSVLSQPRQWCHLYRQCRELCATITTSAWFCPRSLDNAIVWSFLSANFGHQNNPGKLTVSEPLLKSLTLPGLRKLYKAKIAKGTKDTRFESCQQNYWDLLTLLASTCPLIKSMSSMASINVLFSIPSIPSVISNVYHQHSQHFTFLMKLERL